MNKEKFESLRHYFESEGYAKLVSWAVWDEQDIYDLSIFDESNLETTLPKLQNSIAIVGLNACDIKGEMKTWEGFHYKHTGGRDSWLMELVKKHPELEGAFMTDVFKIEKSKSKELKEEVSNNKTRHKEYVKLEKELNLLGNNLTIVLIGDDAEKYFKLFEDEMGKVGMYRLFKIPHYAGRITQDVFLAESEKGLKKEITDRKYSTVLGL